MKGKMHMFGGLFPKPVRIPEARHDQALDEWRADNIREAEVLVGQLHEKDPSTPDEFRKRNFNRNEVHALAEAGALAVQGWQAIPEPRGRTE